MSQEATKVKRTRTMGTIMVECLKDEGWRAVSDGKTAAGSIEFPTTQKAEKWIQENGMDGMTYRIVREVFVVTVKSETVRKVSLFKQ